MKGNPDLFSGEIAGSSANAIPFLVKYMAEPRKILGEALRPIDVERRIEDNAFALAAGTFFSSAF